METMCDSDKTKFFFSAYFIGRKEQRRFVWTAFGTECIPSNSDYVEVAWKSAGLISWDYHELDP